MADLARCTDRKTISISTSPPYRDRSLKSLFCLVALLHRLAGNRGLSVEYGKHICVIQCNGE